MVGKDNSLQRYSRENKGRRSRRRRSDATFSAANGGSATHCIYNTKSVNAPAALPPISNGVARLMIRAFNNLDGRAGEMLLL